MRFLSKLQFGVMDDPHSGVDPAILQRYYGANHGQSQNLSRQHMEDLTTQVLDDQEANVGHDAVAVPHSRNPFQSEEQLQIFFNAFQEVQEQGLIPPNLGVSAEELHDFPYPDSHTLFIGKKKRNSNKISLPIEIWFPRAVRWAQGLYTMTALI
jgi:hypothetical protein